MYSGDMLGGVSEIQTKNKQIKFCRHDRKPDVGIEGEDNCRTLDALS